MESTPRSTVCFSWNQGDCSFPYCRYRHACVRCGDDHKIIHSRVIGSCERRQQRDKDGKSSAEEPTKLVYIVMCIQAKLMAVILWSGQGTKR